MLLFMIPLCFDQSKLLKMFQQKKLVVCVITKDTTILQLPVLAEETWKNLKNPTEYLHSNTYTKLCPA